MPGGTTCAGPRGAGTASEPSVLLDTRRSTSNCAWQGAVLLPPAPPVDVVAAAATVSLVATVVRVLGLRLDMRRLRV